MQGRLPFTDAFLRPVLLLPSALPDLGVFVVLCSYRHVHFNSCALGLPDMMVK